MMYEKGKHPWLTLLIIDRLATQRARVTDPTDGIVGETEGISSHIKPKAWGYPAAPAG